MKIFISWSGEFSQKVAKILKDWMPCVIQSIEVFYSPDDIEKGEKWDAKISGELSECSFGIVCLTNQNINAPWIHFEAGALSKTLDSKVSALMLNINPSDIKGPLSRFQATKFNKDDFYKLLETINVNNEAKLNDDVLKRTFEAMWDNLDIKITGLVNEYGSLEYEDKESKMYGDSNDAIEEVLQLLRDQSNILYDPEKLLPVRYFEYVFNNIQNNNSMSEKKLDTLYHNLYEYLKYVLNIVGEGYDIELLERINFRHIFQMVIDNISSCEDKKIIRYWRNRFIDIRMRYDRMIKPRDIETLNSLENINI